MTSRKELVRVEGSRIDLIAADRVVDSAATDEIVKLFWLSAADPLYHGEESYYVAVLPDRLWVLPYFTGGIAGFLAEVLPPLEKRGALFRAEVSGCPISWRRRIWGLLPLFPTPALGAHPLRTLPSLQGSTAISAHEIDEKGAASHG